MEMIVDQTDLGCKMPSNIKQVKYHSDIFL